MTSTRTLLAFFGLALFAALTAQAQTTAEPAAAVRGMDVVSCFQPSDPVKGQPAFRHDFDGARYLSSSAQNQAAFVAAPDPAPDPAPDRYLPQFGGMRTSGLRKGLIGESDPAVWKIVDRKLSLFRTAERMPAEAQAPRPWLARSKTRPSESGPNVCAARHGHRQRTRT